MSTAPPSQIRRVLIVKLSSIGDVTHALPVASALRRRYPSLRISWAVEEWTAPLVQDHPAVDRTVVFPPMKWSAASPAWLAAFKSAVKNLQEESYDVAVDLQGLFKSALIVWLSHAGQRIGVHPQREGSWLISRAVPPPPRTRHAVNRYLACAKWLDASVAPVSFQLAARPEAVASIERRLTAMNVEASSPLVVINPTSAASRKNWGVERWAAVAGALAERATIVVTGERRHRARHQEIARQAAQRVVDLTGRTTLAELIALLDRCDLHIAPDTGSAHIAAALGRPVIAVYGPTDPRRLAPYGQESTIIYHGDRCGLGCPRFCLRGRACLRAATAEEVIQTACVLLDAVASSREQEIPSQ